MHKPDQELLKTVTSADGVSEEEARSLLENAAENLGPIPADLFSAIAGPRVIHAFRSASKAFEQISVTNLAESH